MHEKCKNVTSSIVIVNWPNANKDTSKLKLLKISLNHIKAHPLCFDGSSVKPIP